MPPLFSFFNHTATTEIYTLSLHDALPIFSPRSATCSTTARSVERSMPATARSEEHTSELQSLRHLVCRLLLEKKKMNVINERQRDLIIRTRRDAAAHASVL